MTEEGIEHVEPSHANDQYVVVARRYRPQSFEELVGQSQVAQALKNAIERGRVGHAYLFTGARGVGKTSSARILAKALNCQRGPSATPCNECDICRSVTVGEDVDVLEIDGASNRGIEEIRQLRSNVNIRPSRARFKIYIIDEVHMFTKEAFNALLKTLEEPPEHVKFIFCTTDPEKIPITVLSRCQRFDFGGIRMDEIVTRLAYIVENEGVTAEPEALRLLARKANGSMRDSQSLLEQLLAFGGREITVADVNQMLGAAGSEQIAVIMTALAARDAAAVLAYFDQALTRGIDPGQLIEQLLGFFRDMMTLAVGAGPTLLQTVLPTDAEKIEAVAKSYGLANVMAAVQILDDALVRMQRSAHARILAEMALVRVCQLEDLQSVADLVETIRSGKPLPARPAIQIAAAPQPSAAPQLPPQAAPQAMSTVQTDVAAERTESRVNSSDPASSGPVRQASPSEVTSYVEEPDPELGLSEPPRTNGIKLTDSTAKNIWEGILTDMSDLVGEYARPYKTVATSGPNRLVVSFSAAYNSQVEFLRRPAAKTRLEGMLTEAVGNPVTLEFKVLNDVPAAKTQEPPKRSAPSSGQMIRKVQQNQLVQQAIEMFGAEVTSVRAPESGGS
ncbi:DNA polymerase III subunit gamma/tau [Blastopirellula marina]|uniref:DNA polymerase III subunit gamma/tau n=1 Tax=Blastopirellula marina DSM 3645 TaxID=314230 RepID=A3ZPF5_9BACT|nr:DNA polymerase III subunit gamma/tau [Blastopirellula marina]EAQ81633.1 DNA polymerase III gamma and tau subunits [Blastopirellula marina DSM 3645]